MTPRVLLSAMHLSDYTYIDRLNIKTDAIIINQCDRDERQQISPKEDVDNPHPELKGELPDGRAVTFISTTERGLSKSRNMAIREAGSSEDRDICILCDNDVCYEEGIFEKITSEYEQDKEADIIVFYIKRPEKPSPIFDRRRKLGYIGAMQVFSPEITFRLSSIERAGLYMNESFGAGAVYGMGEENIFLFNAIGKGLKVRYVPLQIATLLDTESTWFKGYTDKYFIDRGAGYYAMSPVLCLLLILQFAVRKHKEYKADNGMLNAVRMMLKGANEYRSSL